jgi:cytochrome c-type biogenesis protein CcmH/NrfF
MAKPLPRSLARVARALLALAAVLALVSAAGPRAQAATPRASLTDIEDEVMCVLCHTPLAVSESPQANAERAFIRTLIDQGQTKAQIKQALVGQYGQAVLALPRAHGFNLTVYVLPPALLLAGLVALAFTLPRWRRRTRATAARPAPAGPALDPEQARRLEEDLARFDR